MLPQPRWIDPEPVQIPKDFREAIGGHPLVAETLYRRGYQTVEAAQAFLNPDRYQPTSPDELPDARLAYERLAEAINNRARILVWGDFDVDGQTSTTVLVEGLQGLQANVRYHIPIRAEESHGITAAVLQKYLNEGFDLLLTCDTGISEHTNLQTVREAGIPVVVTDHHTLSEPLPPANAIVNPQRLPENHPLRTLPGVGVAYKLMEGLYQYLDEPFEAGPFQELAALGIVADVAPLQGDTRYILQRGLAQLRRTERVGLQTLYGNAELNPVYLTESHIGFQIAPRMNAVGRLGDANIMVEFLTTRDAGRARVLGMQIEAMNNRRRFTTHQVEQAAEQMLQGSPDDRHAPAIVLHHPEWPGGVVGIVANHLVNRYYKPAILLTGEDPIHGSARSVMGINVTRAIASQAPILTSYGGHPMAAGLTFPAKEYRNFKRGFFEAVENQARQVDLTPEIEIHHQLTLAEITLDLVSEIQRLGPFGPGNPALNFVISDLSLVSAKEVGQTGDHRQVIARDPSGAQQKFIWWNGAEDPLPAAHFDLVCHLSQSDYKGLPQVSAEWIAFRISVQGKTEIQQRQYKVLDLRQAPQPLQALQERLQEEPDLQIWGEGLLPARLEARDRNKLTPLLPLVIWTAPPSQAVLEAVLRDIRPGKIILLGILPELDGYRPLMERVGGLVKFVLNKKKGRTSINALAAACAATPQTLRTALQLWEAMGELRIAYNEDQVTLSPGDQIIDPASTKILQETLVAELAESEAFRRYFSQADSNTIFSEQLG